MVARDADTASVRVLGRGTLKIGPVLRDFLALAEENGIRRAVFDLTRCETLDSTFLGIIAGLAMRLRKKGGGVSVSGLSPRTQGLFHTLGIDHLVEVRPADSAAEIPPPAAGMQTLDRNAPSRAADETILEAHEDLVSASGENLQRFRDVIDYMRDSVVRRQSGGAQGP